MFVCHSYGDCKHCAVFLWCVHRARHSGATVVIAASWYYCRTNVVIISDSDKALSYKFPIQITQVVCRINSSNTHPELFPHSGICGPTLCHGPALTCDCLGSRFTQLITSFSGYMLAGSAPWNSAAELHEHWHCYKRKGNHVLLQMRGKERMRLMHNLTWSISLILTKTEGCGHREPKGCSKPQNCMVPASVTAILNFSAKIQKRLRKAVERWADQSAPLGTYLADNPRHLQRQQQLPEINC